MDGAAFALCSSPVRLTGLSQGSHIFEVRAINAMDNFDPTPATWEFSVDSVAPVTTIESGPDGKTEIRRPEFRFSSSDPEADFSCRFDEDPFGPCAEAGSEIPGSALSFGPHSFSVRASDPSGNVGPVAIRSFEVVEIDDPSGPILVPRRRDQATMGLGRVQLDPKKGFAVLPVTVSAPGKVSLTGNERIHPQAKRARGPATVRLRVRARGRALKALRSRGKLRLKVRVEYAPAGGTRIERGRALTLKLKPKERSG